MSTSFLITGIAPEDAVNLFALSDEALAQRGATRMRANTKPGFPCRVSLSDADPGEELILFSFKHHDVNTPYQASGPVFVRKDALPANLAPDEIPAHLSHRQLSLRAYNAGAMMVKAQTAQGDSLGSALDSLFANAEVDYVHIHNAAYGCFLCKANRYPE